MALENLLNSFKNPMQNIHVKAWSSPYAGYNKIDQKKKKGL